MTHAKAPLKYSAERRIVLHLPNLGWLESKFDKGKFEIDKIVPGPLQILLGFRPTTLINYVVNESSRVLGSVGQVLYFQV